MSEIEFNSGSDWVMKLTKQGIFFNRESYPYSSADDFAKAVVDILERKFKVTFLKEEPPYDRE